MTAADRCMPASRRAARWRWSPAPPCASERLPASLCTIFRPRPAGGWSLPCAPPRPPPASHLHRTCTPPAPHLHTTCRDLHQHLVSKRTQAAWLTRIVHPAPACGLSRCTSLHQPALSCTCMGFTCARPPVVSSRTPTALVLPAGPELLNGRGSPGRLPVQICQRVPARACVP